MDMRDTLDVSGVMDNAPDAAQTTEGGAPMPRRNENHTPPRSIRVPDELWLAAQAVASDRGESISGAINRFLARYVKTGINKDEDRLAVQLRQRGA